MAPKAPGRQRRAPRLLEKQSQTPEVAAWAQTQVKAAEETPGSLEEVTGTPPVLGHQFLVPPVQESGIDSRHLLPRALGERHVVH